jgi:hypothetical protein
MVCARFFPAIAAIIITILAAPLAVARPLTDVPRHVLNGITHDDLRDVLNRAALLSFKAHIRPCESVQADRARFIGWIAPDGRLAALAAQGVVERVGLFTIETRGCGYSQRQRVLAIATTARKRGEGPAVRALIPGQTRASLHLGEEIFPMAQLRAKAEAARVAPCEQNHSGLLDTRVWQEAGPANWTERWAFQLCNHIVEIEIGFATNGKGGTQWALNAASAPVPLTLE